MIFYLYVYFMLNILLLSSVMSLYFLTNKLTLFMELEIFKFLSIKVEYVIFFDWINLMFISLVLIISMSVILYSIEYMNEDLNLERFIMLVLLFVISMIFMIISPNMISILLGWDGLGLVSYCLVIYYQNESSFNSGMVTVLLNRIGDIFILMSVGLFMFIGSWNFLFLDKLNNLILIMIILISFTKSAQIPFSSWLPKAMAAPTPVSSLVHSSTLVTAGVYMLIRFNYLINMNYKLMNFIMFMSLMTMFMAGLVASIEFDLKKIIALSTLSQLGVMMFSLSMNLSDVAFFHLMTHALFKSMLFMCAGVIIHNMILNQDIRFISMIFFNMPIVSVIFNCSSFSLMGLPFLSGFFSKDKILDLYLMEYLNSFVFMILFISMGLTSGYSMRLIYYSFIKFPAMNIFFKFNSILSLMVYSMLILFIYTIVMGFILSWMIFSMKSVIFLSVNMKLMIFIFMILGVLVSLSLSMYFMNINMLLSMFNYIYMYYYMWFLSYLYKFQVMKKMYFFNNFNYSIENGWNEYFSGSNLIDYIMFMFKYDFINKVILYIMIMVYYFILILLYL